MDAKQALFFDGIRHCAEIVTVAYDRLQRTITHIATVEDATDTTTEIASAFLDAWAVVDAIDRFRALLILLPGFVRDPTATGPSFSEVSQPIREIRNVHDHLAQRAAEIVAAQGTALGILTWITVTVQDPDAPVCLSCAIVPGIVSKRTGIPVVNPGGKEIELPSGLIHLTAGGYRADLSMTVSAMEKVVRGLEAAIGKQIVAAGLEEDQAGADLVLRMTIRGAARDG